MKTLDLNIELNEAEKKIDSGKTEVELCIQTIKNVILIHGNQQKGMPEEDRRLYYKICDVFEKVITDKVVSVELEDTYAGFIKKCFKEVKLTPDSLLRKVEEKIEGIPQR